MKKKKKMFTSMQQDNITYFSQFVIFVSHLCNPIIVLIQYFKCVGLFSLCILILNIFFIDLIICIVDGGGLCKYFVCNLI